MGMFISPITSVHAQTDVPVVRAVLFYSPSCGHCEYVINEVLVPMTQKYGEQLQIIAIDVTQPSGQELFLAALKIFGLDHSGVPFLVFDDMYLMGSGDIPEQFPGLVETYLANGGLDWPEIPGLREAMQFFPSNTPQPTATSVPVVRAVLFYRSACSHCQKLTQEVIPPLTKKYGPQLEIFGVDVSSPEGDALYDTAIERFQIDKFGVPTLVLGDQVFVGGAEIEKRFESVIQEYFVQGGTDWPDIPGLHEAIMQAAEAGIVTAIPAAETVSPSSVTTSDILVTHNESSNWLGRFAQDPAGNTLSVIVLIGMLGSIGWAITLFKKANSNSTQDLPGWVIPILCIIGFGVAGYLAYVETTQVDAVCGPVGDCNTVQQSEYARLFGILPIGILGLLGYLAIFIAWFLAHYANDNISSLGSLAVFMMSTSGTLFSIHLTFLEPFVIGATCAWCLTSAVLMTILMLLTVRPAKAAIVQLLSSQHLTRALQGPDR
jgi:uncharacterized membrane protein/thiol-disulfide isomerase/thioredoxin